MNQRDLKFIGCILNRCKLGLERFQLAAAPIAKRQVKAYFILLAGVE